MDASAATVAAKVCSIDSGSDDSSAEWGVESEGDCEAGASSSAAAPPTRNMVKPVKVKKGYLSWFNPDVGQLVLDMSGASLAAHCRGHGHGQCRLNRVLHKRPLGYLVAWLLDGLRLR